ncbi:predicted protein [Nematostella vectensis]|uniref:C2H2-type domain-containing protein n=1 Tax=Nematostella vectensis TaxID=45351 RepID=A7S3E7_NEMVE|nr:transcription factor IIIA [Nematostella vectensis]EDO41759.1 predicted protein [Nematostella vectensis]|eukprot:XP_001633822.1 predicted protein [Nematostella vectensis]
MEDVVESCDSADENKPKNVCAECGKQFNKNWRLVEHIRTHTGERPFVCESPGCDKAFYRAFHLKRHQLSHSHDAKKLVCSFPGCGVAFSLKQNLTRHERRSHDQPFKCDVEGCSASFKKKQQLRIHNNTHANKLPFSCESPGCDESFPTTQKLLRHMKKHKKGHVCSHPDCEERFSSFHLLRRHIASHGFTCRTCDKVFLSRYLLKKHKEIHAPDRKVFECPRETCGKLFTKASNLRVHIQTYHEGKRLFTCHIEGCEKTFAHKKSLEQHLENHNKQAEKEKCKPKKKRKRKHKHTKVDGQDSHGETTDDQIASEDSALKGSEPDHPSQSRISEMRGNPQCDAGQNMETVHHPADQQHHTSQEKSLKPTVSSLHHALDSVPTSELKHICERRADTNCNDLLEQAIRSITEPHDTSSITHFCEGCKGRRSLGCSVSVSS